MSEIAEAPAIGYPLSIGIQPTQETTESEEQATKMSPVDRVIIDLRSRIERGNEGLGREEMMTLLNVKATALTRWGKLRPHPLLRATNAADERENMYFPAEVLRFVELNRTRVDRAMRFRRFGKELRGHVLLRVCELSQRLTCTKTEIYRQVGYEFDIPERTVVYFAESDEETKHTMPAPRSTLTTDEKKHIREEKKKGTHSLQVAHTMQRNRSTIDRVAREAGLTQRELTPDEMREMYREFKRGRTIQELMTRFGKSERTVYRIVREEELSDVKTRDIRYIYNPSFEEPSQEMLTRIRPRKRGKSDTRPEPPRDAHPYIASLYRMELLPANEQTFLLRGMNYRYYEAAKMRDRIKADESSSGEYGRVAKLIRDADRIKNMLIESNLRLVVNLAKGRNGNEDFFATVSTGNMALIRAVEKCDYAKGFCFSTYAYRSIQNAFLKDAEQEMRHQSRYKRLIQQCEGDERVHAGEVSAEDVPSKEEETHARTPPAFDAILGILPKISDPRDREILILSLGIYGEPQGVPEIASALGYSSVWVRKRRMKALETLAAEARRKHLDEGDSED